MALKKSVSDELRARYLELVSTALKANGEEVLVTNSNEFAIPCVDTEGNDAYVQIIVKVPTGSHDGEPYNGHDMAKDYALKVQERKAKAEATARKKAEKVERDRKAREEKAKAKAQAEG